MKYIRTCQECGHEQECPAPIKAKDGSTFVVTDSFRQRKCKKCKSPALNYGSWKPSITTLEHEE